MMIAMGRTAAELYEKHSATLARAGSVLALIAIIRLMVRGARTLQARMLAPASLPESWRRAAEEYGPARPPNEVPGTFTYEEMARAV